MTFRVSLQLYTVREAISIDFLDGLASVSEIGYHEVEFAGFGDATAEQAGKRLEALGMRASGAHVPFSVLSDPLSILSDMQAISCTEATLPWVPEAYRADWKGTAARLDEAAIALGEHGIAFGYHNHAFEFENGGYTKLTQAANKTNFQLDVFWAEKAGEDAVSWIEKLSGRMPSIHCKDLGIDGDDIEIGAGVLDWRAILEAAEKAGVTTLVTEMDNPRRTPMESAKACLDGIKLAL
ncbi:MAG: sugar phosphate isomerase/epimerase [Fimbriimonadales bacterium]